MTSHNTVEGTENKKRVSAYGAAKCAIERDKSQTQRRAKSQRNKYSLDPLLPNWVKRSMINCLNNYLVIGVHYDVILLLCAHVI